MKEITATELKAMRESGEDFQLIDVREPFEFEICNLQGELIPMNEVPARVDEISHSKKVVIHCKSGARSRNIVQWLETNAGLQNLYNLQGGIFAWIDAVDPTMDKY